MASVQGVIQSFSLEELCKRFPAAAQAVQKTRHAQHPSLVKFYLVPDGKEERLRMDWYLRSDWRFEYRNGGWLPVDCKVELLDPIQ